MWNQEHCAIRDYLAGLGFEYTNLGPDYHNVNRYIFGEFNILAIECALRHHWSEPGPAVIVFGDPYGKWWIREPIYHSGAGIKDLKKKINVIMQYLPAFNSQRAKETVSIMGKLRSMTWYTVVGQLRSNRVMPPRIKVRWSNRPHQATSSEARAS